MVLVYTTQAVRITCGPKSNFICDNILAKVILFSFGCSEVKSTWLITSELANQRAQKVLFTCVVYTNYYFRLTFQDGQTRSYIYQGALHFSAFQQF